MATAGSGSAAATAAGAAVEEERWRFGEGVPFGDPYWYQGGRSPYYGDSHRAFRARVRAFVDEELLPHVHEWDEKGEHDEALREKAYRSGLLGSTWPAEHGGTPPEGFDAFHDLILVDELSRCGAGGVLWSVFFSFSIALPPVLIAGSPEMRARIARPVITGKKIMCLAVSEPYVGSDVANLRCSAEKRGDHYVVNGEKKWITSGCKADYFTVAVRTGGSGARGISLLLVERGMPGVKTTRMQTSGWWISNTAYVTLDNVKVPTSNLIGAENEGFRLIMHNFNHERFVLAAMANRYARVCLEEAVKYARQRRTFGKRLADHQVLRHKVADMAGQVECVHAFLEQIAYQMREGAPESVVGAPIALAKVQATICMEMSAREAAQIMGGNAYTRGGKGEKVERLYREVRVNAIGGGSEEILRDLAMKLSKL